jgi:hypothetical protein
MIRLRYNIDWEKISLAVLFGLLFVAIFLAIYFAQGVNVGLHNIDLGFNFLSDDIKIQKVVDLASDGVIHPMYEIYSIGLDQVRFGYMLFGMFTFFIGYIMGMLIITFTKKGGRQ